MSTIKLMTNNNVIINGKVRRDWTCDSDDEDESKQKINPEDDSKDDSNFEQTAFKQLEEKYESISGFVNKSKIPTNDNFCERITLLIIVICCRFSIQICEYRSFNTDIKDFFDFPNKKKCKNINKNKVIPIEFRPIFDDILILVKKSKHIPCKESIILDFQEDLKTDSENINTNIFRRSVPRAFD